MYRLNLPMTYRRMLLISIGFCLAILIGCGSDSEVAATADTVAAEAVAEDISDSDASQSDDEDHDDDHGDEDHDEDHGDEDHGDEDHDDEDHDDQDHDDEDGAAAGLGAHVHGEAELLVAWSGSDVIIDLISPTENIFGFEYEPTTDEDIAFAEDRTAALTTPEVLVLNAEADCTLVSAPTADVVYEGSHAEATTSWIFTCENPDQITELDATGLFEEFPGFIDVDAQWASASDQSASELSASSPVLRFET